MKWTLGFNYNLVDSVHNLTNEYLKRKVFYAYSLLISCHIEILIKKIKIYKEIFYASAHTGVIFDYESNS